MRKYKQLTLEKRYIIYALFHQGFSRKHIAKKLDYHPSTIGRELRRNVRFRGYHPQLAHRLAMGRRRVVRKPSKLTPDIIKLVSHYLRMDWSPEQISGRLKREDLLSISHESIYKLIFRDKTEGGRLYRHLRCQKKRRRKYGKGKRVIIPNRISIDDRPAIVDKRNRIGDWEVDTIISSKSKQAILSVVERRSRFTLMTKLNSRDSYPTAQKVNRYFKGLFAGCPYDNIRQWVRI